MLGISDSQAEPGIFRVSSPASDPLLSKLARVLAVLGAEGASVALAGQLLFRRDQLPAFIAKNELPHGARPALLTSLAIGAMVACVLAMAALAVSWSRGRRARFEESLDRIGCLGRMLAPSLLLWTFPPMLGWKNWDGRDLSFLLVGSLIVLMFERAVRISLSAFSESGWHIPRVWTGGARTARIARFAPHALVGFAVVGYVAYMSHYTLLHHYRRQTSGFDLGYFNSFFWNTIHGRPFYCPITHARSGSYLEVHAEFAVYLLAPIYALAPRAETLLVLQSAMLGLAGVPLYLFARRRLASDLLAALVAIAFLLYPPLHSPNFADFHFLTISAFFVLWAAYFFESERWILFWVTVVFGLMCREDVPFGGIAVGLALFFSGRRPKTGALLAIVSAAYLVVVKFVVMPMFGEPSFVYIYEKLVAPGGKGFGSVVRTLVSNPLFALSTILMPEKLPYVLHVFLPIAFLPLRKPRLWFLLFPGFFVTLLSTGYMPVIQIRYQYVTHFTPYVFIGAVLVLELITKELGAVHRRAAAAALALGTLFATHQFGALQRDHFFGGGQRVAFEITEKERENLQNLREIAQTIPANASLAATELDCAHVSSRTYTFSLKYNAEGADYLLYSHDALGIGAARRIVSEALTSGSHGLHAQRPGFVVLRRGAPIDQNAALLNDL